MATWPPRSDAPRTDSTEGPFAPPLGSTPERTSSTRLPFELGNEPVVSVPVSAASRLPGWPKMAWLPPMSSTLLSIEETNRQRSRNASSGAVTNGSSKSEPTAVGRHCPSGTPSS